MLAPSFIKRGSVTVVGIANSIEMFEGVYSKSVFGSQLLCENEFKIIFPPYKRNQVVEILKGIVTEFAQSHVSKSKRQMVLDELLT